MGVTYATSCCSTKLGCSSTGWQRQRSIGAWPHCMDATGAGCIRCELRCWLTGPPSAGSGRRLSANWLCAAAPEADSFRHNSPGAFSRLHPSRLRSHPREQLHCTSRAPAPGSPEEKRERERRTPEPMPNAPSNHDACTNQSLGSSTMATFYIQIPVHGYPIARDTPLCPARVCACVCACAPRAQRCLPPAWALGRAPWASDWHSG